MDTGVAGGVAVPLGHDEAGADQPPFDAGSAGVVFDGVLAVGFADPEPAAVPRVRAGVVGMVDGVDETESGMAADGTSAITFSVPVAAVGC